MRNSSIAHWYVRIVLVGIVLFGGYLRMYNINWDDGHMFHPDERNIANAVARISVWDQMNPDFFAYGGLTIYLYKMTADNVVQITDNPEWAADWGKINIIGRYYSALFSTLTIIAVFILTRKLFDEAVALLASFLFAFTVFSIQSAHYSTTESLLGLFAVLIATSSLAILKKPTLASFALTGILLGIAVAAKTSALSFLIMPAVAIFFVLVKRKLPVLSCLSLSIILFCIALSLFSVLSPYTFLTWNKFSESMEYEGGVVAGTLPVPYTLQFTNTIKYIFRLQNLFWQMGVAAAAAIAGVVLLLTRILTKREMVLMLFLSFPIAYFLYVGAWHAKFIRYMAPLLPFFAISTSYALLTLFKKHSRLGEITICVVSVATILWALAFFTIYTRPQTRITASEWIYANIPAGSSILGEHWDDGLPIGLDEKTPGRYNIESLEIYNSDDELKRHYYAQKLSNADYVVINSRRLYGTLLYLPEKYPLTKKYYERLFTGLLGYEKVAEFTSYPSLFGFEINDDYSEETFQVYEHPKVLVFKNTARYSQNMLWNALE